MPVVSVSSLCPPPLLYDPFCRLWMALAEYWWHCHWTSGCVKTPQSYHPEIWSLSHWRGKFVVCECVACVCVNVCMCMCIWLGHLCVCKLQIWTVWYLHASTITAVCLHLICWLKQASSLPSVVFLSLSARCMKFLCLFLQGLWCRNEFKMPILVCIFALCMYMYAAEVRLFVMKLLRLAMFFAGPELFTSIKREVTAPASSQH